jgi:DASS family divalent anion:Na+ symporter
MASSGLLFRVALLMLRVFPPTHRGQILALVLGGIAVTPLVPTVYGRVATAAPIALELAQALGYSARTRASASLLFAAIVGNSFFSPIFLTGVVGNFLILELIPAAERARFDWLGWLFAAAPAGIVILIGSVVVLFGLVRPEVQPHTSAAVRRSQERALGPLSSRERASLAALAVFVLGLLLQPLLRVDIAWIALAGLLVAIAGGALDRQAFRNGLDWATLIFFGVLIGAGGVLKAGGVDRWVADLLSPTARSLGDPALVVLLLALVPIAVRLVLPMAPSAFLLVLTLVPAAPQLGLSGWVVGFVVFTTVVAWVVPSQYELLRIVREMLGPDSFTQREAALVGAGMTVVVLVAVVASLPFWRAIGLL